MTFDEKLKARAAREGSPIPEGFDSRMDALLDTLPAGVQPAKKRRAPRLAVCIGIAAAMVVGAAAAAPAILKMAQGAVDVYKRQPGCCSATPRARCSRMRRRSLQPVLTSP